ncbi:hypothetical protein BU17DRAFT_100680 [Hysterangium stoloniferum]|nr:hypothetical protein BU17DRAFT_100680 [Hysterangium stoloniferum]
MEYSVFPNDERVEYFYLEKTIPSLSHRYDRTKSFSRHPVTFSMNSLAEGPVIDATDGTFKSTDNATTAGWVACVHPEGLRYYYHPVRHVVTDANLTDDETLAKITFWTEEFHRVKKECGVALPSSFELLLELDLGDEEGKYYIVDHERQRIFYFDAANTEDVGLPDVYSEDHLKLQLEGQYWNHVESFPMHYSLPSSAEKNLVDILRQAWADRATSSLSTSPFSAAECKEFMNNLTSYSGWKSGKEGYHAWMVARLLKSFIFARFVNRYGEVQGARLSRTQSLEAMSQKNQTWLFVLLSRLLFNQPGRDLNELHGLWVDNIVYTEHWRAFNVVKVEEWYGVCAMGTMLLIASMVIDHPSSSQSMEVAIVISEYGAAACRLLSLSAIILGLKRLLVHKNFRESSAFDAAQFLTRANQGERGLSSLAVVLSLPRGLLMWALAAMVVSLVSINFECFVVWRAIVPNVFMGCLGAAVFWATRI